MRVLWLVLAFGLVVSAQSTDKLSEVESLRLQLQQTQIALEQALATGGACRAQLRSLQLTAEQATLKTSIEHAHPGYVADMTAGTLTKAK